MRAVRATFDRFFTERGTHLAAMVAYFALMSFVPLVFLALSILGFLDQADSSSALVTYLEDIFPERSVESIVEVVNAVQRLKKRRQMIFITHNANLPVLAEAELVLVMNSDGRVGGIEKCGTVDECREQIIDLLEGGREAFELRSKRYAAAASRASS